MKVLLIGSGGREHAMAHAIAKSPLLDTLWLYPGNDAMLQTIPKTVALPKDLSLKELVMLMVERGADIVVIGPEVPLVEGWADEFRKAGILVFGPSKLAAQLEGSKEFAKHFMKKYHIPTAEYAVFSEREAAKAYVHEKGAPIVIKKDGLAAGKGVVVAFSLEEAEEAIEEAFSYEDTATRLVIEEFMAGEEASLLCFADGSIARPMVPAQDHKRAYDYDKGPNTGGMGSYAPAPVITEELLSVVMQDIVEPTMKGMQKEGMPFVGCLYVGLMITQEGPKVVEYNVRFGDPETQVILPLLESDILPIFLACARGDVSGTDIIWKDSHAVCVVMASQNYPYGSSTPAVITGMNTLTEAVLFHAGTQLKEGAYWAVGGRVLGVVSLGDTLEDAVDAVYETVRCIHFKGMHYRKDIAAKAMK